MMHHSFTRRLGIECFLLTLVVACGNRAPTPLFSAADLSEIRRENRFSKPAGGNQEALPAPLNRELPLKPQLKTIDSPLLHADQCRAVLGPIPDFNCMEGNLLPVYHDGKLLTYSGGILREDGAPVDAAVLHDCDDPAMLPFLQGRPKRPNGAGKRVSAGCMINNRVGRIRRGTVDWIFSCHYRPGMHEPNEPYDFVSVIGSNSETGETCFFAHDNFKMSGAIAPAPGANGSPDEKARAVAAHFWNFPSENTCIRCHAANKPWAVTPHLHLTRLTGEEHGFDFMPETPKAKRMKPGWGFRLIGSVHNLLMARPKVVWPKNDDGTADHTCTRCHLMTGSEEYVRLARMAVGLPDMDKYEHRTRIMPHFKVPWMPRYDPGAEDSNPDRAAYQQAVLRLERAVFDKSYRLKEAEVLTPCPEPAALSAMAVHVARSPGSGTIKLAWSYRNDYGHVPLRDDIRFAVAVESSDGAELAFHDLAPTALGSAEWEFRHPSRAGVRYRYRLEPYRYCFDLQDYRYAKEVAVEAPNAER